MPFDLIQLAKCSNLNIGFKPKICIRYSAAKSKTSFSHGTAYFFIGAVIVVTPFFDHPFLNPYKFGT